VFTGRLDLSLVISEEASGLLEEYDDDQVGMSGYMDTRATKLRRYIFQRCSGELS
jgi:hypothetical protein